MRRLPTEDSSVSFISCVSNFPAGIFRQRARTGILPGHVMRLLRQGGTGSGSVRSRRDRFRPRATPRRVEALARSHSSRLGWMSSDCTGGGGASTHRVGSNRTITHCRCLGGIQTKFSLVGLMRRFRRSNDLLFIKKMGIGNKRKEPLEIE